MSRSYRVPYENRDILFLVLCFSPKKYGICVCTLRRLSGFWFRLTVARVAAAWTAILIKMRMMPGSSARPPADHRTVAFGILLDAVVDKMCY